jgi:hypothetical protein
VKRFNKEFTAVLATTHRQNVIVHPVHRSFPMAQLLR